MGNLTALLSHWRADPTIGGNIVAWKTIPARTAQFVPFPANLHPGIKLALEDIGIRALYTHQNTALEQVRAGQNIAIVTHTASGKSLCYNLPILEYLIRAPEARALYLFPTKALAQDQLTGLQTILGSPALAEDYSFQWIAPAVYDGDTSSNHRVAMRNNSRILISNPDMLHTGILPHHTRWAEFFRSLRFVVIDEMHTYRGVFGSHVANIIRRLTRIATFYGARPQFILTSATIGNPDELALKLIAAPVVTLTEDGAGRGPKHFLIYNPPILDPDLGLRAGLLPESNRLAEDLLAYKIQTIVFGRTRRAVELMRRSLSQTEATAPNRIKAYRSGYLPRQRRAIEAGLRAGEILTVFATTALELGIDIGQLQAAVLAGYPGSIAGTWQQAGRAGRGQEASLAILVTSSSPLDQFLAKTPEYLFEQPPEQALINPDNLLILLDHLQCAAYELPFSAGESFGNVGSALTTEFLEYLRETGSLHKSGQKFFWMADQYPAAGISLRNASAARYLLQISSQGQTQTIGEVDGESVHWMVHPEAIYLHQGDTFLVDELDLERKIVILHPVEVDYYTRPRQETEVHLLEVWGAAAALRCTKTHGEIKVTSQVVGFHKIRWGTNEKLGFGEVDLPPSELQTTGYWLTIPPETADPLREAGLWSNDPNAYGPNWPRQRDLARARDDFKCQVCGLLEDKKSHHVHHKTPYRTFQSADEANHLDNLVTLCPGCHHRVENSVRIRSGLAGLAHILGHLAPLFLMCDGRDLGVHHDPQSPLTAGQPTVVIYDRVPGGIGFSQRLFEIHLELLHSAYDLAASCDCKDGCPACVGPGGEEGSGSKKETVALLKMLARP